MAGGQGRDQITSDAELYDPSTGKWTSTGNLLQARHGHRAILLTDGRVLVAGGQDSRNVRTSTAELFDPSTERWTETGSVKDARFNHTLTRLKDGNVLMAGGIGTNIAELYNPVTGQWTQTGLHSHRQNPSATLLPDGRVLLAGGFTFPDRLDSAELYDPATGQWTQTGNLGVARVSHTGTLLADSRVLVAGGSTNATQLTDRAELYDPIRQLWTPTGSLSVALSSHIAALLADKGRVLVAGGSTGTGTTTHAELFDPLTGSWAVTNPLDGPVTSHAATLLADGRVLVSGGIATQFISSATGITQLFDYSQLLYPQLALGGGFEVVLLATNQGREDWRGRGELDNRAWPPDRPWALDGANRTGRSGFDIQLEPNQTKKFILSSNGPVVSGWLEIRGKPQIADLATTFFYNFFAGAELGDSTGVGVAPAVTAVTFPVERSAQINTGIALRQTQAQVNLRLYDEAGVSLGAGRRSGLFPNCEHGTVRPDQWRLAASRQPKHGA